MSLKNTKWSTQDGFNNLSAGAREIATYADSNDGSIAGVLQQKPELIGSIDEFHQWTAITLSHISGNSTVETSGHSLKKRMS